MYFFQNYDLEAINFPVLRELQGGIEFKSNQRLRSLALDTLRAAQFATLSFNYGLESVSFDSLTAITGADVTEESFVLEGNDKLVSAALPRLTALPGGLVVKDNKQLKTVDVGKVTNVKYLHIARNSVLNATRMDRVTTIDGANELGHTLYIYDNLQLIDVSLAALTGRFVGGVYINSNPELQSIDLGGVSAMEFFKVITNSKLTTLALTDLASIFGADREAESLVIRSADKLTNLTGLRSLAGTLDGALMVRSNEVLESLVGLGLLSAAGHVTVEDNANLASLEGLEGMTTLTGKDGLGYR
jgi:hypothetical protein